MVWRWICGERELDEADFSSLEETCCGVGVEGTQESLRVTERKDTIK